MTASPQHQTTSFSSRGNRSRFNSATPPPAAFVSSEPALVGRRFSWVRIISPERRWSQGRNHSRVLTECQGCGAVQWTLLENLRNGRSKGCQHCSQPRQIPRWLDRRLTAARRRCENLNDPEFQRYGARGIRFEFASVTAAGAYLIRTFGLPDRQMEIDRIDNNGPYAPGNIRFATRTQNAGNREITVLSRFEQRYWPYAETTTRRKLAEGMTRKEIILDAETAVFEHRKNWKGIRERLKCMTYEMPDDITVLPYRGGSFTTAATAGEPAP